MRRRFPALPRWAAMMAVLAALLLRAGLPAGYMIGTDAAGAVTIELCSGRTMVMQPPRDGGDQPARPHQSPCPFGVLAAPATPPAPPLPVIAAPVATPALLAAPRPAPPVAEATAPPPPATGPPPRA